MNNETKETPAPTFHQLETLAKNKVLIVSVPTELVMRGGNVGFHNEYLFPWSGKAAGMEFDHIEITEGCDEYYNQSFNKSQLKELIMELTAVHDMMED